MSLIPYQPQEGREIVLRHRNAIVVRDQTSQRLELRSLTECPTCRRPLRRAGSPERTFDSQYGTTNDSFVDPDYFRMLRAAKAEAEPRQKSLSPVRRFVKPALTGGSRLPSGSAYVQDEVESGDTEFVSSSPGISRGEGSRIRKEAFSPNYFKTFFKEERILGKGGKGVVLLVRHELDEVLLGHFACKRVPVGDDHDWLEKVLIEVGLLAKLSHPNLVSYRHVWLEDARLTRFGPPVVCAFILQQYCNGGDLHQYLVGSVPREMTKEELKAQMRRRSKGEAEMPEVFDGKTHLTAEEIYSLFKDITSGVAYLHAAGYIHRDLKPSNCLLHREGGKQTCLISDFGEVQQENVVRKSTGSTGTISYCAPEVLKIDPSTGHYSNFTAKSDIFSLGMILYFMCFGKLPYRSANAIQEELEDMDELRAEITEWQGFEDERRERPDLPARLYKLLKKLLSLNPSERPSAHELLVAMKGEYLFDSAERSSSPQLGLHGHRIQSLDSPAVPGTPVPDPRKSFSRPSTASRESLNGRGRPGSRGETALVGSNGLRPRRPLPMAMADSADVPRDEFSPRNSFSGVSQPYFDEEPRSPPLLMAPPRSRLGEVQHRLHLALVYLLMMIGVDGDGLNHLFRVTLFLIKIGSLGYGCWPYMTRLQVGIPLLLVACLDLRQKRDPSTFVVHRPQSQEYIDLRIRGFWTSLVLLILHGGVVWTTYGWKSLCVPPPHEEWAQW